MKNKKLLWPLLIGFLLIYLLWPSEERSLLVEVADEKTEIEPVDKVAVVVKKNPAKALKKGLKKQTTHEIRQPIKTTKRIQAKVLEQKPGGVRNIPAGMVEFELVGDNWAIAAGDIVLGKLSSEINGNRGTYKPSRPSLWPSRVIPYAISSQLENPERVTEVVQYFNEVTSIQLVPFDGKQKDYIVFVSFAERCASYLGKVGGPQPIFLSPECGGTEITHELMHALGFIHEQSRQDRDQYVKVHWDKIEPEFHNQYDILPADLVHSYTGSVFNFDYNSVMLYGPSFFALHSGDITMSSTTSQEITPARGELSTIDIERLAHLYD